MIDKYKSAEMQHVYLYGHKKYQVLPFMPVYKVFNLHLENDAQCTTAVVPIIPSEFNTLHLFFANRFRFSLLFVLPSPVKD
jgi:hypothetical protein